MAVPPKEILDLLPAPDPEQFRIMFNTLLSPAVMRPENSHLLNVDTVVINDLQRDKNERQKLKERRKFYDGHEDTGKF